MAGEILKTQLPHPAPGPFTETVNSGSPSAIRARHRGISMRLGYLPMLEAAKLSFEPSPGGFDIQ